MASVDIHAERPEGAWVTTAPDGTLQYATDAEGDRIPDFSTVGFRHGLERIPTANVAVTVNPGPGDDSARIQAAIDAVSALPIGDDGLRGAVLLTRGQYEVADTLRIAADGVVLRGEGQYGNGTVLTATGTTQRRALEIVGPNDPTPFWTRVSGSTVGLTDDYVPVGATSFNVAPGHTFAAGDSIVIDRGSTQAWFEDIGVDQLDNPWVVGTKELRFDRTVTAVDGNTITVNAPIVNGLEQAEYGDNTVYKYTFPDRVQNVGVENLRFVAETNGSPTDENHAWTAVWMDGVEDVWVRQVDAKNFGYAAVETGRTAKTVTVEDVSYLEPVSLITGSRRYSFTVRGSENLVQRVFSEDARHDFVLQSTATGPNVFLFATAKDTNNDIGPHHRWSAGTLFDNVHVTGDNINVRWRGNSGSGHGWAGANMVIWNSVADAFEIQNPPTAQNWVIGALGLVEVGNYRADEYNGTLQLGNVDSLGTPVAPNSLYIAQLRERFGSLRGDTAVVSVRQEAHLAGDIDNFTFEGSPADNFTVDSDFLFGANETSSFGLGTFDSAQKDRMLAFTYDYEVLPGEEIIGATLTMQLRVLDTDSYANDVLRLDNHAARFHLTDTLDVPTTMQTGDDYVLQLELTDFFGPLLAPLQDGQFNVFLSDDHAIDYAILNLEIASLMGDMDVNGKVDLEDVTAFIQALQDPDGYADLHNLDPAVRGDLTGDGVFDLSDVEPFAQLYGVSSLAELRAIPEPSGLAVAALMAAASWRRGG
ncbi:MAG: hypothetical protein AAF333_08005 [Planctomycetota bacterium]